MFRNFISSDCFDLIVDVSSGYIAGNRGLYIFLIEISILDSFKSIVSGSSRSVGVEGKGLFCLFSKFLSS